MPAVLRVGPYRFFFYSADREEPPHVHVERDDCLAKFWLAPARFASNHGFHRSEMARIERIVLEHELQLQESWDEYFGGEPAVGDGDWS